jgi:ribose transport system ATP-binding protein
MTAVSADTVLSLGDLSKTFSGTRALDQIDLNVCKGEIHALIGQNGSGKSTLIKILAGFHQPDAGAKAEVRGLPFELGLASAAHAAGIRFVHQDLGLVPTLDAIDNLALGFGYEHGRLGRIRWSAQRRAACAALDRVGVAVPLRPPIATLSVFERTALAIARALQNFDDDGSLLVLDEPTAAMPRPQVEQLFELLRSLRSAGTAVLLVTHHLDEVFSIADRVTVLRDGRRVGTALAAQLTSRDLMQMMIGDSKALTPVTGKRTPGEIVLQTSRLSGSMLTGLDLTVRSQEIVGVAGLNGSGREELCNLLFGADKRKGTVTVAGTFLPAASPAAAVAAGVGLVPADRQRDGILLTHTVRENLTLVDMRSFRGRIGLRRRAEQQHTSDWISRLKIRTASTEVNASALSGGNQQKVVIGKWLRTGRRVLLLDEPTQGVDVAAQAEVHELVSAAAAGGCAVLVCSSDENELAAICDRVVILNRGEVGAELCGGDITAKRIVQLTLRDHEELQHGADPANPPPPAQVSSPDLQELQ